MVSSQYGTDSFVSVWYFHGTNSGNFQKTFDDYHSIPPYWINYSHKKFYSTTPLFGKVLDILRYCTSSGFSTLALYYKTFYNEASVFVSEAPTLV